MRVQLPTGDSLDLVEKVISMGNGRVPSAGTIELIPALDPVADIAGI